MKTLLIILFPFLLVAQDSTSSKFYYMASSILYGITAGIGEGYRVEYEQGGHISASKQELNAKWHNWKLASAPFIVGTGYTVALNSGLDIPRAFRGLFTSAVLAWISHDIAYNATRKLDIFRRADSPAITEMNFSIKLVVLGGVLLLEYLLD
ncbi:MAG: hypothetical protein R6W90_08960 [Ignavibacteriaceae bacterium]